MEVKNLRQQGNKFLARFVLTANTDPYQASPNTVTSPEYIISGTVVFQIRFIIVKAYGGVHHSFISIRFVKFHKDDVLTYAIKFTSIELKLMDKNFVTNDGTWYQIYNNNNSSNGFWFDVSVVMDVLPRASSFANLHEDTELTDFELRGEDGSVHMHRAVLAAASPVLRRMLSGKWKESSEGRVDVPGNSKATLQNLKDFIYLHTLPDDGLDQLLLLASFYMIKDLEIICVHKLVNGLTAENVCDLLEFAAQHKLRRLLLSILEWVQSKEVTIDEMRDFFIDSDREDD